MKIAIVGSRRFTSLHKVQQYIAALPKDTTIISGGEPNGVDRITENAARRLGLKVIIYPAEWDRHGKMARLIRNTKIVETCDELVGFWDGRSNGTRDVLDKARKANKLREVINP